MINKLSVTEAREKALELTNDYRNTRGTTSAADIQAKADAALLAWQACSDIQTQFEDILIGYANEFIDQAKNIAPV